MRTPLIQDLDPFNDGPIPEKKKRAKPETKVKRLGPFTTKAAKEWARSNGWRILHSEGFDSRLNRTYDAWLASDVVCSVPSDQLKDKRRIILIQAGQKGEEKAHRSNSESLAMKWAKHLGLKPEECTLERVCAAHGWAFLWVEFERGSKQPKNLNWWVGGDA